MVLQGTTDDRKFAKYQSYFETQPIYLPKDPIETAITAARIYFDCRRRGITVRSSNDCLIAQTAVEHNSNGKPPPLAVRLEEALPLRGCM